MGDREKKFQYKVSKDDEIRTVSVYYDFNSVVVFLNDYRNSSVDFECEPKTLRTIGEKLLLAADKIDAINARVNAILGENDED